MRVQNVQTVVSRSWDQLQAPEGLSDEHCRPELEWCVGRPTRRRSESGHDGGWRLRLVAVANCETADRSIGLASAHAAAPGLLAGLPLSNGDGSVVRGRSREAARGSARAGTLGRGGGPWAPGLAPGGRQKGGQQGGYKGSNFPKGGRSPGPRAWGARRGRAVTCARGGVACGCAATTYVDRLANTWKCRGY